MESVKEFDIRKGVYEQEGNCAFALSVGSVLGWNVFVDLVDKGNADRRREHKPIIAIEQIPRKFPGLVIFRYVEPFPVEQDMKRSVEHENKVV